MFAIVAPAFAVLVAGSIELAFVNADRTLMQDVADAAAITGAKEFGVAPRGATERAKAFAEMQLAASLMSPATAAVEVSATDEGEMTVTIKGHRPSFFGSLLPPGGWKPEAQSRAAALNLAPLCVLAIGEGKPKTVDLVDTSMIEAGSCLIHSNEDMVAEGSSKVNAAMVQVVTTARGSINPKAMESAGPVEDPFVNVSTTTNQGCTDWGKIKTEDDPSPLAAGVHCGKVEVSKGTTLTLSPGNHYFRGGELNVKDDGVLYGRDVVIVLDKDSKLKFQDEASVDLEGRKAGPLAGFLIVVDRANTNDLEIWSDHVDNLLGVVYAPRARLTVLGSQAIAENSDWTVVVAKSIQMKGSAKLTINANYTGSSIPVPGGVGPRGGGARLMN